MTQQPDDSPTTSTDGQSTPEPSSSAEAWWEDLTSRLVRRNWSPQRRKQRAEALRLLRRINFEVMRGNTSSPATGGLEVLLDGRSYLIGR
jgi:hypothetical protein